MITKENIIWSFDMWMYVWILYEMNEDQSSGRSRPSEKEVGGGLRSSRPWDGGGGGRFQNKFFLASVLSKIKGGGPSPGSATAISLEILYVDLQGA